MLRFTAVLVLAAATFAAAAPPAIPLNDSLVNGRFKLPLETGWAASADDPSGSHTTALAPEGGVRVFKEMCGTASLAQDVRLKTTDVVFRASARLRAEATRPGYYSTASILLGYLDKDGKLLGETRVCRTAGAAPGQNTAVLHVIPVADNARWDDYVVDIAKELKASLPGVSPAKVARLRVQLESYCSGTDPC